MVVVESRGGGFYIQNRVGKYGVDFKLLKFRSMRIGSDKKGLITVGGKDARITKMGFLSGGLNCMNYLNCSMF